MLQIDLFTRVHHRLPREERPRCSALPRNLLSAVIAQGTARPLRRTRRRVCAPRRALNCRADPLQPPDLEKPLPEAADIGSPRVGPAASSLCHRRDTSCGALRGDGAVQGPPPPLSLTRHALSYGAPDLPVPAAAMARTLPERGNCEPYHAGRTLRAMGTRTRPASGNVTVLRPVCRYERFYDTASSPVGGVASEGGSRPDPDTVCVARPCANRAQGRTAGAK